MCLGRYAQNVCLQGEGKGRGVERVTKWSKNLTEIFILLKKRVDANITEC